MADTNIYEKLRKVQQELKVPKSQRNSFGNYNYRSCEDILEAVKPVLDKYGLFLTISDTIRLVGDRYYTEASVTIGSSKEDAISVTASAREEETKKGMDGAQITGASSSYARKYALNGLFAIDDTKDADSDSHGPKEDKPTDKPVYSNPTAPASEKQRQFISKKLAEQGISIEATPGHLVEQYGVTVPLTKEGAGFVIDHLIGAIK